MLIINDVTFGNKDALEQKIFGCKKKKIKHLPNTKIKKGTHVPCTSVFRLDEQFSVEYFCDFTTQPLVWGYNNPKIIDLALSSLDNEQEINYWEFLEKLSLLMEDKVDDKIYFFDSQLNKKIFLTIEK